MFQVIAFDAVQATAQTEQEARYKAAKIRLHINAHYRGPGPVRVCIAKAA